MKTNRNGGAQIDTLRALHHLRDQLAEVLEERNRVAVLPVPLAEAVQRFDDYVSARAARYEPSLVRFLAPEPPKGGDVDFLPFRAVDQEAALCALAGELLKNLGRAHLGTALKGQETIGTADRRQRLADLDARRRELEFSEERLVAAAEAAGFEVYRRADADPAIIFAVADEEAEAA